MEETGFVLGLLVALVGVRVRAQIEECYTRADDRVVYEGRVNVSEFGDPCLHWSATGGEPLHNYCRAPRVGDLKPWCYVLVGGKSLVEAQCDVQHCTECYTLTGSDYRGNQSEPYSAGVRTACMSWADTGGGKQVSTARYPGGAQGIGEHSYCRQLIKDLSLYKDVKKETPGYLGCYNLRYNMWTIMRHQPFASLTIPSCLDFCRRQGVQYGGVSQGTQCYCIVGPKNAQRILREVNDCGTPCSGDNRQFCGGQSSMALFDVKMGRCGGYLYSTRGTVYSPNWPDPFPTSNTCSWTVTVPEDKFVRLRFKYYDIPDKNDYVSVWNNETDSGVVLKPQDMKDGYVVESNTAHLYFSSDPHGSGGGFSLLYEECYTRADDRVVYEGRVNVSEFGDPCLHWSATGGEPLHNYCRAPRVGDLKPWCYVLVGGKSLVEAQCDIQHCTAVKQCTEPNIPHGMTSATFFLPGHKASFRCRYGFTRVGPRTATCQDNGEFDQLPKCVPNKGTVVTTIAMPVGPSDRYGRTFSTEDSHDTAGGLPTPVAEADPGTSDRQSSHVKFSYVLVLIVALSIAVLLIVVLLVLVLILCKQYGRPFSTKDSHDTAGGLPTPVAEADPGTSDRQSSHVKFSYVLILIVALSIAVLLIVVLLVLVLILCKQKKERQRNCGDERRNGELVVYETVPMTHTKSPEANPTSNGHTTFHPPKRENIYDSVPEVQYATVNKRRQSVRTACNFENSTSFPHDFFNLL
uniref:Kringle-containing protein marking the eye and the nose n=1 Tax=Branchiostoma floridae TaxID=7739 RepID=C3Y407_BRAFL|eukprot:XP_002609023.1 hypothetical protein BRAFLDRAFT_84839 [Branchiostoma floridae]